MLIWYHNFAYVQVYAVSCPSVLPESGPPGIAVGDGRRHGTFASRPAKYSPLFNPVDFSQGSFQRLVDDGKAPPKPTPRSVVDATSPPKPSRRQAAPSTKSTRFGWVVWVSGFSVRNLWLGFRAASTLLLRLELRPTLTLTVKNILILIATLTLA